MSPTLLLYNLGGESAAILARARADGFSGRVISPLEQGLPLSAALAPAPAPGGFGLVPGQMLVFFATPQERMYAFLDGLRRDGLALGALKAVATATNLSWPAPKLYAELLREHNTMGG